MTQENRKKNGRTEKGHDGDERTQEEKMRIGNLDERVSLTAAVCVCVCVCV